MTIDDKAFLDDYPLSVELQEAIDNANSGDIVKLNRILAGCLEALQKLNQEGNKHRASSRIGLATYYRRRVSALISLVEDGRTRAAFRKVYMGEQSWQRMISVN